MDNYSSNEFFSLDSEYQEIIDGREWMDCPEQRLVWAIIERSVRDALGNQPSDVMSSIEWFWKHEVSAAQPFSFQWCCETLGIEAGALREKILKMREQLHKSAFLIPEEQQDQAAA